MREVLSRQAEVRMRDSKRCAWLDEIVKITSSRMKKTVSLAFDLEATTRTGCVGCTLPHVAQSAERKAETQQKAMCVSWGD